MTKAEWISVIQNTLKMSDESGLTRAPLIERHIQSVYEQMYNEMYASSPRGIWKYVTKHSTTATEGDPISGDDGLAFPKQPIQLPRVGGGLFRFDINLTRAVITDYEGYFINEVSGKGVTYDTQGFKGLYVAAIVDNKLYVNNPLITPPYSLNFYLIPKFTALASTDEVLVPGGAEDHFIDRIIDTIRHMPPPDLINDNAIS